MENKPAVVIKYISHVVWFWFLDHNEISLAWLHDYKSTICQTRRNIQLSLLVQITTYKFAKNNL